MYKLVTVRRNLINKYGYEILYDFNLLSTKHYSTLSEIALKYNFSRERARQLYNELFSIPYREIKRRLKEDRDSQLSQLSCIFDPNYKVASLPNDSTQKKGAEIELLVFNKCKKIGLSAKIPKIKTYDLIINNHKIDVKSAYTAFLYRSDGHCRYFRFHITNKQLDICKFIICYPVSKKVFYIIPRSRIKANNLYIRENDNHQHPTMPWMTKNNTNYQEYKEAWYLLN